MNVTLWHDQLATYPIVAGFRHRFSCSRRYRRPMFDPSGPQPQSVYWRRRVGAVVATIVAVVLLAWIIGSLIGDDGPGDPGAPGMAGALTTRTSVPPSSPPSMTRYTKTSGATTAPPATTSTMKPKPKPQPPIGCADAAITVTAQLGAARYRVGQHPVLKIVIGNDGQLACTRDISRKLRELIVVSGDGVRRMWSSNDCAPSAADKDVRLLQPGQKVSFSITWAGRTSAKGCPVKRSTVPAGNYYVVAKLGKLAGHPTAFKLTS